ncbi:hypothetical protein ACH4JS_13565 [Streptomyces sp. NPDC017638]|uniref:SLOG cluster 4 domain-containing protein n=1 Tax=Streptomyces sp. NPDC017638 TaxID=3365004 RepID=UPI0037B16A71
MTTAATSSSSSASGCESRTAVFFGGVVPASAEEEHMAEQIGTMLAESGFTLVHGGYNGLMEAAARPRPPL